VSVRGAQLNIVGGYWQALLAKDRNNPDLMFLRGKALLYGGSTDKALKHFQEALRVDPDHARARDAFKMVKAMERVKTAGNDAFKAGNCAAAIEAYTEALGMDPLNTNFNATIYCNRAAAKMKHSQYKSALQDCDEALKLSPSYIKAVTRRGDCLLQLVFAPFLIVGFTCGPSTLIIRVLYFSTSPAPLIGGGRRNNLRKRFVSSKRRRRWSLNPMIIERVFAMPSWN